MDLVEARYNGTTKNGRLEGHGTYVVLTILMAHSCTCYDSINLRIAHVDMMEMCVSFEMMWWPFQ